MLKPNIHYLGFDDRKLVLFGIPIVALAVPIIFFNIDFSYYLTIAHKEYFESLLYSTGYWLGCRYLMIAVRKRYDSFELMWKRLGVLSICVLILGPLVSGISTLLVIGIYHLIGTEDIFEPTFLQASSATYFLIFTVITLYEAIYFFHKYKEAILEKEKIQRAHIQGQLDNLRNQINPHFLFNSLNTLMNLIPTDSDRAMNYLSKLSKFYRYTVSKQEDSLVMLQTELENVQIYADLLKERFHNGIQIDLPNEVPAGAQILPLCLQLLIENAVKHNIVSNKNTLKIAISLVDNDQYIQVTNNIQQKIQEVKSTGMGLKNIRSRIAFFTEMPLQVQEDKAEFKVLVPLIYSSSKI